MRQNPCTDSQTQMLFRIDRTIALAQMCKSEAEVQELADALREIFFNFTFCAYINHWLFQYLYKQFPDNADDMYFSNCISSRELAEFQIDLLSEGERFDPDELYMVEATHFPRINDTLKLIGPDPDDIGKPQVRREYLDAVKLYMSSEYLRIDLMREFMNSNPDAEAQAALTEAKKRAIVHAVRDIPQVQLDAVRRRISEMEII